MKTNARLFLAVFLAALLLSACSGPATLTSSSSPAQPRTIKVTGDAEVRTPPDQVILTLGVETSNLSLDTARQENDAIVRQVLAVTSQQGIPAERVQTEYLGIEPRYRDSYEKRDFLGFYVRKTIVITLGDVSRFEDLLDQLLAARANYVQGIEFRTTALRQRKDEARALAIRAAREKAEAMAKELGQSIGRPLAIEEEQSTWYSPYSAWWGGSRSGMAQNVVQNVGQAGYLEDSAMAPGQIAVQARVSVEFELK